MASTGVQDSPVYQLKISLKGVKPQIWRRIQVRGNATMARLHIIIQAVILLSGTSVEFLKKGSCAFQDSDQP